MNISLIVLRPTEKLQELKYQIVFTREEANVMLAVQTLPKHQQSLYSQMLSTNVFLILLGLDVTDSLTFKEMFAMFVRVAIASSY